MKVILPILPKILPMATTSLEELEEEIQMDHIQANTYHLVKKNRENRSSGSWDNLSPVKKRKKLRKVKYIARSATLPSGLHE